MRFREIFYILGENQFLKLIFHCFNSLICIFLIFKEIYYFHFLFDQLLKILEIFYSYGIFFTQIKNFEITMNFNCKL